MSDLAEGDALDVDEEDFETAIMSPTGIIATVMVPFRIGFG